jgi:hypothetical protein
MPHTIPNRISNRTDARRLWLWLLSRGISFHWEDDPRDWGPNVLSDHRARHVERLFVQVEALNDTAVYDDAVALLRFALTEGPRAINSLSAADVPPKTRHRPRTRAA